MPFGSTIKFHPPLMTVPHVFSASVKANDDNYQKSKLKYSTVGLRTLGFSLLEVLIALVILSFSLSVLYQAAAGATRNVRVASEFSRAIILAESILADHSYVTENDYSANGHFDGYQWVVTAWPAESELDSGFQSLKTQPLLHLQVVVRWPGKNKDREINLVTIVPLIESSMK